MASSVKDISNDPGLGHGDIVSGGTSLGMAAACKMGPNSVIAAPSNLLSDDYNAQSKFSASDDGENSRKLFPSLLLKTEIDSPDSPLSIAKVEDADSSARLVQPPWQAGSKGTLYEDWLQQHLKTAYPDKGPWRALELFTEDVLYKAFPDAQITAQATEVPGTRPDFVLKHGSRTVVIDSKCYTTSNLHKRSDVDKLLRDMENYNASVGILVVRDKGRISEDMERYCENNKVAILEANRKLADNFHKVIECGDSRMPPRALKPHKKNAKSGSKLKENHKKRDSNSEDLFGPLKTGGTPDMGLKEHSEKGSPNSKASGAKKKDGTPNMRMKSNNERGDSNSEALVPLKKDGIPDMRFKANHDRGDPISEAYGKEKKEGNPGVRMKANYESGDSKPGILGPMKKTGTPDMRFKSNYEHKPVCSKPCKKADVCPESSMATAYSFDGPLKKDGTPDMRFKSNYEHMPVISETVQKVDLVPEISSVAFSFDGPLKKDGTPDMRYKASYGPSSMSSVSASRVSSPGCHESRNYSYNGNPFGPVTKSGLPDMRFKANRY